MMASWRRVVCIAGAAAVVTLAGCVRLTQQWTIFPDGSGKARLTIGLSEQQLAMSPDEQDPFAALSPANLVEHEARGWVAFTEPVYSEVHGYRVATITESFDDLNEVRFPAGGNDRLQDASYRLGDGQFTVTHSPLGQVVQHMHDDPRMNDAELRATLAPSLAGLELVEAYHLPGRVIEADGYTVEGEQATVRLGPEHLTAETPPDIDGLRDEELTIAFEPAGWGEREAAWRQELADAKTRWQAIKEGAASADDAPAEGGNGDDASDDPMPTTESAEP